jgi:hypothetical protein
MATVTLITPTITEGMGIIVFPITIMAIIRTVTMGEVGVFDVQVVEHLTLAIGGEAVRVGSYFGYFTCSFRLA